MPKLNKTRQGMSCLICRDINVGVPTAMYMLEKLFSTLETGGKQASTLRSVLWHLSKHGVENEAEEDKVYGTERRVNVSLSRKI